MTQEISSYTLEDATMLLEMNASVWTARRLDKGVSAEVVANKSAAAKDAARVNKDLFAGRSELKEIQSIVGEARTYVYANTAVWSDNGQRLLPTSRLLKIDAVLSDFRDKFNAQVDAFVQIYPTLITAQAMALGDMFKRDEYPLASDIRRRFAFSFDFFPLPRNNDFRVAIAREAQDDLRQRLEKSMNRRVENAMGDLRKQLKDHLARMSDRLTTVKGKDGEDTHQRFHDTLVTNAYDLCDLIGDFNMAGDKELSDMKATLEAALSGCTADTLRTDYTKREDVKKEVDALLDAFSF